jgi:DNA-binding XRE family transcriptional regulator
MESDWRMDQETRRLNIIKTKPELDEFCERYGYTNEMLAEELDVSRATIFNWKKDGRPLPRIVSLALYALESVPGLKKVYPKSDFTRKQYRRGTDALKFQVIEN